MNRPRSRRCSYCDTNWPVHTDYETCPKDGRETWLAEGEEPLSFPGAAAEKQRAEKVQKLHEDFETYYAEREVSRLLEDLATP